MKNWAKFLVLCLCAFQVSVGCAFDASSAREAGANWLIERVGDRGGWEAYGDASAYAIRAFVATGRTNTPEYQRVLDRLLSLRMADGTYPSGAWSIWALAEAGYTKDDDELQGAVNSLINKYDPANCWGTNVSVNALNVIALVKAGVPKTHPCIKGTVNWLKKYQNSDGYWGGTAGSASQAWYSPSPVVALCLGDSVSSTNVQSAVSYLYAKRKDIGPLENVVALEAYIYAGQASKATVVKDIILSFQEDDGGLPQLITAPSCYLPTAYGATSLGNMGLKGPAIDKCMGWVEAHIDEDGVYYGDYQNVNFSIAMVALSRANVDNQVVIDAMNAIMDRQSPNGSWSWWSYYLAGGSNSGEIPASTALINSIYDCGMSGEYSSNISKAVNYLSLARNADGGWGEFSPSLAYAPSNLSCTTKATEALLRYGYTTANSVVSNGVNWIVANRDGEAWGVCGATALAVRTLYWAGNYDSVINDAVDWLYANQNADGGWGVKLGEASTVGVTSQVLITLGLLGHSNASMVRGGQWLLEAQNPDGGWSGKPRVFASDTGNTSYAVWALSQNFNASGDLTVVASADKETYVQGETAVVSMAASKNVGYVSCYVTDPAGWAKKLYLTKDDATHYHINLTLDQYRLGDYSILVEAESADGEVSSDVCGFGVECDYVIPGDVNKDSVVDLADLSIMASNWLKQE